MTESEKRKKENKTLWGKKRFQLPKPITKNLTKLLLFSTILL